MPGLVISVGGRLDASFKNSLDRANRIALAEATKMAEEQKALAAAVGRSQMSQVTAIAALKSEMINLEMATRKAAAAQRELSVAGTLRKHNVGTAAGNAAVVADHKAGQFDRNSDISLIQAQERDAAILAQHEMDEEIKRMEVEAAARSNTARKLLRQRKADAASSAAQIAEAELAAQVEVATRSNMARRLWRQRAEAKASAAAAAVVDMTTIARQGGWGIMSESGHKYGGKGGVISEVAVLGHELLQGRGSGRILGPVSILAQRLGLLGTLIKSTASEEIKAAHTEADLAGAMARTWYAANKKAEATVAAGLASGLSKVQAEAAAAADIKQAAAAMTDATAQKAKAAATVESAEVAAAAASVSLGPIGWLLIAGIALTAVIVGLAVHFHTLAKRAQNLADLMNPLKKKFTEQADALRENAKDHQQYLDWLKNVGKEHETLPQKIDEVIKKMREQAAAEKELAQLRGASKLMLEAMDEKELQAELLELSTAKNKVAEAEARKQAFDPSNLKSAQHVAANAGAILDAVQAEFEKNPKQYLPGAGQGVIGGAPELKTRPTNESDLFTVSVDGKEVTTSLGAAKAAYDKSTRAADALATEQQKLADTLADSKKTTEEKDAAVQQFQKRQDELTNEIGIKTTIGRQIAAFSGGGGAANVTERERIGLGAASSIQVSILDVAKQHKQISVQQLAAMQRMVQQIEEGGW